MHGRLSAHERIDDERIAADASAAAPSWIEGSLLGNLEQRDREGVPKHTIQQWVCT